jgi:hypothetical protein
MDRQARMTRPAPAAKQETPSGSVAAGPSEGRLSGLSADLGGAPPVQRLARLDRALNPAPAPTGPVIQRREATAGELGLTRTHEEEALFDSPRVTTGRVFEKEVSVGTNKSQQVIAAYITEARNVGTAARAAHGYTDQDRGNPVAGMPAGGAWQGAGRVGPGTGAYLLGLVNNPGLSPKGIEHVDAMDRDAARDWIASIWQQPMDYLNDHKLRFIDPFLMKLTFKVDYHPPPGDRRPRPRDWVTTTQFSHSANGYLIEIDNGEKDIRGRILTAADFANVVGQAAANRRDYNFSSTHVQGGGMLGTRVAGLAPHEAGDTKDAHHEGFDAFTWLAAEGARYQPVAMLGEKASPTSAFYIKPAAHGWAGARSVTLTWLMQNWGGPFQGAYNIDAATMRTVIGAPAMPAGAVAIAAAPAGRRYNLTKEKAEG